MKMLHVICDLQFGSTGKGLFAGYLAKRVLPDTLITAWGPNAGHTFVDAYGKKHVNIMMANGVVAPSVRQLLIGPGSVIDPDKLMEEMARYGIVWPRAVDSPFRVAIHEHAAVVQQRHRDMEAGYGFAIGSTMKGVGEAVIEKIKRRAYGTIVARDVLKGTALESFVVTVDEYNSLLNSSDIAILEGAQGFSLSINQGMYPYTTSRDCTTHQLLSDCGIPRNCWVVNDKGRRSARQQYQTRVYGVARTYPIRVANRFNDGVQVGTSGPGYPDQLECQWEDIGREPELTTVTKLPRRIFTFSPEQIRQAVRMNGVDFVFLNFCNYVKDPLELDVMIRKIEDAGPPVTWTGWGPREDQVQRVSGEVHDV